MNMMQINPLEKYTNNYNSNEFIKKAFSLNTSNTSFKGGKKFSKNNEKQIINLEDIFLEI